MNSVEYKFEDPLQQKLCFWHILVAFFVIMEDIC